VEKLIYPLWKPESLEADTFRDTLLSDLANPLCDVSGVRGLRVCVADSAVEAANGRRMQSSDAVPDAVISLWVDDAGAADKWEPLITQQVERMTCYLVAEAEPLLNQAAHPTPAGERMYGMCHVVFMSPPESMDREDWLSVWKGSHTQVAIDTQSTFGYRQNVIVRALGENTPVHAAIVEENFPPEAMSDDHAFYATGGDEAVLQKHMTEMMESCSRFIDFAKIDVLPMSEYLVKPVSAS
jgi:hypothetical protein